MINIYIKYNPYRLQTIIEADGHEIEKDSILYRITKGKRLQEWCGKFPEELSKARNSLEFDIKFYGNELDYYDLKDSFEQAKKDHIINDFSMSFISGKSDDDIHQKIVQIFNDLQEGPVEDFRDVKLRKAFDNVNNAIFPINVIATMSSGKSTLINALLSKKLMPSKNEACTAVITEILDRDESTFKAVVYNSDNERLEAVNTLTYEEMLRLNENPDVFRIVSEGEIPFITADDTALKLIDTPGPNNARNQNHKNTTYRSLNSDSNNLILYVLNGTQLSTNDDAALLNYVSEQIKKGGKQARDRFLFVINKMDSFNPEEEDIGKAIESAKNYLSTYGIEDPQIYPVSAYTALNIRTELAGVDIDELDLKALKKLSPAARDAITAIDKFNDYEEMHLEKYSTLSPSAHRELDYRLHKTIEEGDTKEQALIHCGICSIEAAIIAYVKKYAKTKKIKDLVETFQEVLFSNEVLAKAKTQVATDEAAAKACAERAAVIREKIADGAEASEFKSKVAALDPMPKITAEAKKLEEKTVRTLTKVFRSCPDVITNRDEAIRLIKNFSIESSDAFAELSANLESIVNKEIIENGNAILSEYQQKLEKIDGAASDSQLDFATSDLIKGALNSMKEEVNQFYSGDFASDTIDEFGEITYEEREYYEKTGQKAEKVFVGTHEEVVGTKTVKTGSHTEYRTRTVANPKKQGLFGKLKFWQPNEIDEDYEVEVDDYEEIEVTKTVKDYETVMRDVFERRTEKIEKFGIKTSVLQTALMAPSAESLENGIKESLAYAEEQIESMKKQFGLMFDELDELIQQKYDELEACANDANIKQAELERNKKILEWIEACSAEINSILEI